MAEYIEREVAIKAIEEVFMAMESWVTDYQAQRHGLMTAITTVMDVPAADAVPVRHGRWISDCPGKRFGNTVRLDEDGCPVETCHCSECGEWLSASDEYPVKGRFCPNCGARMDGDGE